VIDREEGIRRNVVAEIPYSTELYIQEEMEEESRHRFRRREKEDNRWKGRNSSVYMLKTENGGRIERRE